MATPPIQSSPFGLTPDQKSAAQTPEQILAGGGSPDPSTPSTPTPPTPAPPTGSNLAPGAKGQDVQNLQNYLIQMGYAIPDGSTGNYGPQTTAAVQKMQQDLGVDNAGGVGYYGPKTQQALSQKYNQAFAQLNKNGGNTDQAGAAKMAVQNATNAQTPTDPVMGAMMNSMAPIMQSLTQVLNNINNPGLTAVSLQQEYNQMAAENNLPGMQADMLNMSRIMTGTEDDIRDELTKGGGGATESQVLGMAAARNKVIMKQYNTVATQYQAAQTNVSNMMQYATTDQATQLQRQTAVAGITENMASIEAQMMTMGMTMQQNAKQAVQYNVTQMGYKGLAASAQGNPQMTGYYENMLGLAPGTLSDPNAVAQMDTYKDQTLQLNNYKAAIAAYNAGYGPTPPGTPPSPGTTPSPSIPAIGSTPVDPTTLVRPPFVPNNVPLSLSAAQMDQYMKAQTSASVDPGTHNIVAPGIGYYKQQSDGSYVLNSALPSGTDQQYSSIKQTIANSPDFKGSPTVTRKWSLSANAAISSFKDSGTYKILSNVAPYLTAIHAAAVNPGDKSISDFELLDSFIKASKGGTGQVTDSQVNVQLQGASLGDKWDVLAQKLQQGGVLAPAQRQALISLAEGTFNENAKDYKKVYVQAIQDMQGQGIPVSFWRNMPDFSTLVSQ